MNTYNVTVEKKKDKRDPTFDTLVKNQKDYTAEEKDFFLKH